MKVTSENYNNKNNLSSSSLSSRDMDAMSVLNLEYNSMTSSQKNILDERIMEAEEEEENYKNERAKMKAMSHTSRTTTTRSTTATRSITNDDQDDEEEEEVEEVGWSLDEDALVQKLTRTYLFDFDAVAQEMNKDKKDVRLRFALLSSNNGVAPIAVPKKKAAKKITRKNVQSKTTSSNSGSGSNSGGGSVRASYTPWSSESDDRSSSGSGTAVMGITAPPQAPGNDSFNSKVMRILPVSVNLDALPSMMDSEEDSEEEEDDGNGLTTDVDAMD